MGKKKKSLTFRDLIEQVNISVKSGNLETDYPDLLKGCKDLGISSYILNTIIIKAKEVYKNNINKHKDIDPAFVVHTKPTQAQETGTKIQVVTKTEWKTSKTAWIITTIAIVICIAEALYTVGAYSTITELSSENNTLTETLKKIHDLTNKDSTFYNWDSSNHDADSKSYNDYRFTASEGYVLLFDYYVSSEYNYDNLTIELSGDSIEPKILVKKSGDYNSSIFYVFDKGGTYNLHVEYTKDSSYDKNRDCAGISNICLYGHEKEIIDEIHSLTRFD